MPTEVIMPKVDMDMATGRISRWFKAEGEAVAKGELLFEIETDKAAMEIDAPAAGRLGRVTGREGVDIPVGQAVAWIYAEGEDAGATPNGEPARADAGTAVAKPSADAAVKPFDAERALAPVGPSAGALAAPSSAPNGAVRATPLARRLARQRDIDLASLSGSGPHGRIQAKDIDGASPRGAAAKAADAALPPAAARPTVPAAPAPSTAAPRAMADGAASSWLRREGEGVPLVLIHGFGSESASWRPFLAAFPRPMPILAIELPGHGAAAGIEAAGFDDLVAHAESELAAQGIAVAHLGGHSLGGAVAVALGAGAGVEARSLFLLAPAGLGPEINTGFTQGFAAARDEAALRSCMRQLVADPAVFSDGFTRATARGRADGRLAEAQTRLGPRLFADGTQRFSVRPLLERLPVRAKLVAGTADRIIPAAHMSGLPGRVALHLFAGLGHMPHLEDPVAVAALLDDLVR